MNFRARNQVAKLKKWAIDLVIYNARIQVSYICKVPNKVQKNYLAKLKRIQNANSLNQSTNGVKNQSNTVLQKQKMTFFAFIAFLCPLFTYTGLRRLWTYIRVIYYYKHLLTM